MSRAPETTRVAVAQMRSGTDVDANRASIEDLVARAAAAGADLVSLPEYATYLGSDARYSEVAEPLEGGTTLNLLSRLAREHGIAVLLGSMVERGQGGALHNTSVLLDADGDVVRSYRKVHLFTSTLPEASASESDRITPGDDLVTADWRGWRLGLSICFDVRFPELYRDLAADGADILSIPAAFVAVTGKDHWDVLLRARAIENQAYVLAPAQIGPYEGGGETYGRSCIIDPWGTVLAVVGDSQGTGVAVADLDRGRIEQVRKNLPALANRRFGRAPLGPPPRPNPQDRSN